MIMPALVVFRRYLVFSLAVHLGWELLHLPLYAQWRPETGFKTALFLARCIGADVAIAVSALVVALVVVKNVNWPLRGYAPVTVLAVALGLAAAVLIERYHVGISQTWVYSDLMPIVPYLGAGLSPLAQWIVVPLAGLWWARRGIRRNA